MIIDLVSVPDIDRVWPMVAPMVSEGIKRVPSETTMADLWANCRSGQWFLLIAHDGKDMSGVSVWRFTAHGYFDCAFLTGERLDDWISGLITTATVIGKNHQCRGLSATGRTGLLRHLKRHLPAVRTVRATFASEF